MLSYKLKYNVTQQKRNHFSHTNYCLFIANWTSFNKKYIAYFLQYKRLKTAVRSRVNLSVGL